MDLDTVHERLSDIETELAELNSRSDDIDAQFEVVHSWEGISQELNLALMRVRDAKSVIEDEQRLRDRE